MRKNFDQEILPWVYKHLLRAFGRQYWWPAKSPFEVIVGAILTQGTAWSNVEKSIRSLKKRKVLHPRRLYHLDQEILAKTIRSSGFFNIKTKRLKNFLSYLFRRWGGSLKEMFEEPTAILRQELLTVSGLGRETVDSILLYAGEKPIFVVDAYTRRIFSRHGLIQGNEAYDIIQRKAMRSLPHQNTLFNEYHALLVEVGKRYCRTVPHCEGCPLDPLPRTKRGCQAFLKQSGRRFS